MSAGYSYGIDALSTGTNDANFVVNQGTDADINVRAQSILLNSGTTLTLQGTSVQIPAATPVAIASSLTVPSILANSLYFRGVAFVAAAAGTADFSAGTLAAGFPAGSRCYYECSNGAGSFVSGTVEVGAGGTLSGLAGYQGPAVAPVTAGVITIATSVLSVAWTGQVATTNGYYRFTRIQI